MIYATKYASLSSAGATPNIIIMPFAAQIYGVALSLSMVSDAGGASGDRFIVWVATNTASISGAPVQAEGILAALESDYAGSGRAELFFPMIFPVGDQQRVYVNYIVAGASNWIAHAIIYLISR